MTNEPQKISIPITESDIEDFKAMLKENTTISWTFCGINGEDIVVEFMSEDELIQRNS
jgi:hypothetical protein